MYRLIFMIWLAGYLVPLALSSAVFAATRSSSLYSEAEQSIYQIQVLNKKTGNKSTIGSGFLIGRGDILATNYHVVSEYVNDPDGFRLVYLSTADDTGSLELLGVDVLHDLAVLRADSVLGKPLKTDAVPEKGAELYSLGNPLDLGFSIVSGINNGVLSNSEDNNILFSGNLNPGMSGGPTLNEQGDVVGINVATAGNDVSFLVSAHYLDILLETIKSRHYQPSDDLHGDITHQLTGKSIGMLGRLTSNEWDTIRIGQFEVPAEMGRAVSCWDNSSEPQERGLLTIAAARCSNELQIYLDKKLSVGGMRYQYTWYEADEMIAPRFYRNYESMNNSGLQLHANKKNVTNFDCFTRFVDISSKHFKMTICRRHYRRYLGLSDVLVTGAMVSEKNQGLLFDLYMPGADFNSSIRLLKRMLEVFKWQG